MKRILFLFIILTYSCKKNNNQQKVKLPPTITDSIKIITKIDSTTSRIIQKDTSLASTNLKIFDNDTISLDIQEQYKRTINRVELLYEQLSLNNKVNRDSILPLIRESCGNYYKLVAKLDAIELVKRDSIEKTLITKNTSLTTNQTFVNELLKFEVDSTKYLTDYLLYPMYNFKKNTIGGYVANYQYRKNNYPETELFQKTNYKAKLKSNYDAIMDKLVLYDNLLDTLNTKTYHLSTTKIYDASFKRLGKYQNECDLHYYFYESDISIKDNFVIGSKYNLDLEFISNEKLDSLISHKHPKICQDCPTSYHLQKSFAKLVGFDNLYFTYTNDNDKNSFNKTIDTPTRSLVYYKNDILFYLWQADIDMFGCSCL